MNEQITIVAGGWSASQLNLERLPGTIIAVNDSAMYLPKWDICVSMDRLWAEHRVESLKGRDKAIWLRSSTMANIAKAPPIVTFNCDHRSTVLAERPAEGHWLNGTHSGFCALNLAYQMRPRDLYLVGFDMALGPRGERHWFPDYPWKNGGGSSALKLREWAFQFKTAYGQLRRAGIFARMAGVNTSGVIPFPAISRVDLEKAFQCAA